MFFHKEKGFVTIFKKKKKVPDRLWKKKQTCLERIFLSYAFQWQKEADDVSVKMRFPP